MSIVKIHKILTLVAVVSVIISCTLLFLNIFEQTLRLDFYGQFWGGFFVLGTWAFGSIALCSCAASIVLSLYRIANKN